MAEQLQHRMTLTRNNIEQMLMIKEASMDQKDAEENQEEETLCEICYTNPVVPMGKLIEDGNLDTVEFECGHRFCSDCTVE